VIPIILEIRKHQENKPCDLIPTIEPDQVEGLVWLKGVLGRIVQKPRHANHGNAKAADSAIAMFLDTIEKLHKLAHKHEDRIAELETELEVVQRRCATLELIVEGDKPCAKKQN
jgi:hypothetical protein